MRSLLILTAAVSLSGCISFPDAGDLPPRLSLDPSMSATSDLGAQIDARLVIADPDAEAIYNTARVAIKTGPYEFAYLEDAEWTDRVPVLLRLFLERQFENAQLFEAVGDRVELPRGGYTLQTDIRQFFLDRTTDGPDVARISIGTRLAGTNNVTLGTRVFKADVALAGNGRDAPIAALNEAASQVSGDILSWSAERIRTAEADAGA